MAGRLKPASHASSGGKQSASQRCVPGLGDVPRWPRARFERATYCQEAIGRTALICLLDHPVTVRPLHGSGPGATGQDAGPPDESERSCQAACDDADQEGLLPLGCTCLRGGVLRPLRSPGRRCRLTGRTRALWWARINRSSRRAILLRSRRWRFRLSRPREISGSGNRRFASNSASPSERTPASVRA